MQEAALLLKYGGGTEGDGDLNQRMNDEYIRAFVPHIARLKQAYGYNSAYIIAIKDLLEDQIALLKSRGATYTNAEIIKFKYQPVRLGVSLLSQRREVDELKFLNYLCVFNRYQENRTVWIEAYSVPHHHFNMFSQFHFSLHLNGSVGSYGGGCALPSVYS